ncbi:hypothetical protein KTQ42_07240|uniref:hypothetical protein n=1 Tax=Noviherbaspirillum sp. L7-7A TaxID=2850560 RepID=UPI001C2C92BE|nr:hypothetical protein [Noviherbaspirillum sp. L7-7A]MBV0879099.1 hypothetical protein [Noviherbaspirillum sp. L7-7A]
MTMENSGHEETGRQPQNGEATTPPQVRNPSRRRFTRAGVGASAVILTLTSRSVLAQTACKSPSGFASANLSQHNQDAVACDGVAAANWLDPNRQWPVPKETRFIDVFGSSSLMFRTGTPQKFYDAFPSRVDKKDLPPGQAAKSTSLDEATLYEALNGGETPGVVKSLIAAYLNFKAGLNSHPTDLQAIAIFKEWQANGIYTPSAGIKWSEDDIMNYLGSTQGRPFTPPNNLG